VSQGVQAIEKLPKWAQQLIRNLERERDTALNERAKVLAAQSDSTIAVQVGSGREPTWRTIPEAPYGVRFSLNGGPAPETRQWLDVRERESGLVEVMAHERLVLHMHASNVVYLGTER